MLPGSLFCLYLWKEISKLMVEIGIKGKQEIVVTPELTAKHIGSGTVLVFATPAMIALMEKTSLMLVKPHLEEGQETVGTLVNVTHDLAVPVGKTVRCESEVIGVDRRRITFRVAVYYGDSIVGQGTHERFIIDEKKFREKLQ